MQIEISGIPVQITKKNIKNMHLYVKPPDGHVEVSAPLTLSDESIGLFVRTKLGWIRAQQAKFAKQERQTERQFTSISAPSIYKNGKTKMLQTVSAIKIPFFPSNITGKDIIKANLI